jgi:hypothetical protein
MWTEQQALSYLIQQGADNPRPKTITKLSGGFKGLKACSAIDYLKNYCKYIICI